MDIGRDRRTNGCTYVQLNVHMNVRTDVEYKIKMYTTYMSIDDFLSLL